MKRSLKEVMAEATRGSLGHNTHDVHPAGRSGIRVATVYGVHKRAKADAALLAHKWNHFDKLLAALKEAHDEGEQLATELGRLAEYGPWLDRVKTLVAAADEVEIGSED